MYVGIPYISRCLAASQDSHIWGHIWTSQTCGSPESLYTQHTYIKTHRHLKPCNLFGQEDRWSHEHQTISGDVDGREGQWHLRVAQQPLLLPPTWEGPVLNTTWGQTLGCLHTEEGVIPSPKGLPEITNLISHTRRSRGLQNSLKRSQTPILFSWTPPVPSQTQFFSWRDSILSTSKPLLTSHSHFGSHIIVNDPTPRSVQMCSLSLFHVDAGGNTRFHLHSQVWICGCSQQCIRALLHPTPMKALPFCMLRTPRCPLKPHFTDVCKRHSLTTERTLFPMNIRRDVQESTIFSSSRRWKRLAWSAALGLHVNRSNYNVDSTFRRANPLRKDTLCNKQPSLLGRAQLKTFPAPFGLQGSCHLLSHIIKQIRNRIWD